MFFELTLSLIMEYFFQVLNFCSIILLLQIMFYWLLYIEMEVFQFSFFVFSFCFGGLVQKLQWEDHLFSLLYHLF